MNTTTNYVAAGEKRELSRKRLLSIGAGALALLSIDGAGFAIWNSRGVSRAERIATREERPSGRRGGNNSQVAQGERRGGPTGRGDFGQRREQRTAQMAADLGLTTTQQTQMKSIGETFRPQMQALWQNQSLSRDDRRTQMQNIRQQMNTQMRQLMTPEQQQRFDAMRAQRQARRQEMQSRREQTRQNLIASGQTPPERGQRRGGQNR